MMVETIINSYYENNAKKLRNMVDKILFKLKFVDVDNEDFYSLANEIFVDVLKRYDNQQDFDGFIYSCLVNKFKTEMTRRNRQKRQADRMSLSWETPLDEEGGMTIGDLIEATKRTEHFDIDKTFFDDEDGEKYTEKMLRYIAKLSNLQREVVKLIISGYESREIEKILHINSKQYQDCMIGIRSYRNAKVLL